MIWLFWNCLAAAALVFVGYPALLVVRSRFGRTPAVPTSGDLPTVTVIVVARNAGPLLDRKLANCLALDYPADRLSFVLYSDGSTDDTGARMQALAAADGRCQAIVADEHAGKIAGLNRSVAAATGDILLFTDVDAMLPADSLKLLVRHFADERIGGVCGRRAIGEVADLAGAQSNHIKFSTTIQMLESRYGSVTSSEGKLYAMRRALYEPIADAVTDDLYTCLTVVHRGYRFVLEPAAVALVHLPSRSLRHEIVRRRRIVSTSLRGIARHAGLLNPFRYGLFSLGLLINKLLRRVLTLFLAGLLIANAMLLDHWFYQLAMVAQLGFYGLFPLHLALRRLGIRIPKVSGLASTAAYFVVGNLGSLIGVVEFLLGRQVHRWEPIKNREATGED